MKVKKGRKPKYKEPTTTMAFRLPISKTERMRAVVRKELDKYLIESQKT